jgi:hypothetical protein
MAFLLKTNGMLYFGMKRDNVSKTANFFYNFWQFFCLKTLNIGSRSTNTQLQNLLQKTGKCKLSPMGEKTPNLGPML